MVSQADGTTYYRPPRHNYSPCRRPRNAGGGRRVKGGPLLKYTNDENAIRTTTTNNFTKDVAGAGGIVFLKRGGDFEVTLQTSIQEAQLMLTTGSTRLAVKQGQQTQYHSMLHIVSYCAIVTCL